MDVISRRRMAGSTAAALAMPVVLRTGGAAAGDGLSELDPKILPSRFQGLDVTFCVLDLAQDALSALNADGLADRHAPWSTFKIPNLIIALESGVAHGLYDRRRWDRRRRPATSFWPQAWRQDQTLSSAFKRSVPWYFQEVALDVGSDAYRRHLTRFRYGHADVPDGGDDFWLGGSLEISLREQVAFLRNLVSGKLAVTPESWAALREVSRIKAVGDHALHGKTGAGPIELGNVDGPFEGWLVGWVEQRVEPSAAFALYLRGPGFDAIRQARLDIAEALLRATGHWP